MKETVCVCVCVKPLLLYWKSHGYREREKLRYVSCTDGEAGLSSSFVSSRIFPSLSCSPHTYKRVYANEVFDSYFFDHAVCPLKPSCHMLFSVLSYVFKAFALLPNPISTSV